jgi:hypothetical protein
LDTDYTPLITFTNDVQSTMLTTCARNTQPMINIIKCCPRVAKAPILLNPPPMLFLVVATPTLEFHCRINDQHHNNGCDHYCRGSGSGQYHGNDEYHGMEAMTNIVAARVIKTMVGLMITVEINAMVRLKGGCGRVRGRMPSPGQDVIYH